MSCRRVSRELIERFRFGELDRRSAPHLDHLVGCGRCQEEIGFDRALVRQLRRALAERIAASEPSPLAFAAVRERALREEQRHAWSVRAWRWARVAPAGAAMAVMLFAVATGGDGSGSTAWEPRSTAWPGVLERADNDPGNGDPWNGAWYLKYLVPSPPATGPSAYADPAPPPPARSAQTGIGWLQ